MAEVQTRAVLLINGFDLSGFFKSIDESATQDILDATTFDTDGAKEFKVGGHEREISAEGFFSYNETDAFSVDKLFSDAFSPSAERLFSFGMQGGITVGDIAVMANLMQSQYAIKEVVNDLIMATFAAKPTKGATQSGYARGIWLMSQTVTGAVNGTTVDNGASSVGYFAHVHNTNSDGTATVKIQHSVDGSTWADLIDFGAVASVGAEQAVNTATTVNRYRRAITTAIGGTTNKVSVAFKSAYSG